MAIIGTERVLAVQHWTDTQFTFSTTRDRGLRFENGQFVMVGLMLERPLLASSAALETCASRSRASASACALMRLLCSRSVETGGTHASWLSALIRCGCGPSGALRSAVNW